MLTGSTLPSVHRARGIRAPLMIAAGVVIGIFLTSAAALGATAATTDDGPIVETIDGVRDEASTSLSAARTTMLAAAVLGDEVEASPVELDATIDTTALRVAIERLDGLDTLPLLLVPELSDRVEAATGTVKAEVAQVRARFDEALAEKAAADAAAEAAAQAAAAAAALAAANTVDGAKATARQLAAATYGWGDGQFSCLSSLWMKESGWNYQAYNAGSGATGIPQALPGSKMASAGADWQTSAATQIAWGLDYISRAYGSPCAAWGHSQAVNWY